MRKQLLLIILCLSTTMVWAEKINVATARMYIVHIGNRSYKIQL